MQPTGTVTAAVLGARRWLKAFPDGWKVLMTTRTDDRRVDRLYRATTTPRLVHVCLIENAVR